MVKTVFPASYSTLCSVALSSLISEKYNIENVDCKLLIRGVGDTYLVVSSEARFILRVYRASHRSLSQIRAEITLLLALKKAGVSVSYPIADISGEPVQQLEAIEGTRHAVLFSYAPGKVVKTLSENQLRAVAREMARFHNVSSSVQLNETRWNFDPETTLFEPLKLLKPAFAEDPEGYAWLQQTAKQAAESLSQLNAAEFSKGYCHFDFLPKNFHFEGDSVTFFDFDFMGYGWLVNDIMTFYLHLALDVFNGRMTQQAADNDYAIFLDAYRQCRPVSEEELAVVPYLIPGFWLFYMGFHTTHDQFYAFIQPAHLKAIVGLLKHMVGKYWAPQHSE